MYGIIYMTTNLVNGKRYIGQHKCKNDNDSYLGSGKILKRAIEKYGRENFERKTLCICDSFEEMNEKEKYYIKMFDASHSEDFYNIQDGGAVPVLSGSNSYMYGKTGPLSPVYGRAHTEDEKRRISESQKGKTVVVSEETKRKISQTMKEKGVKPKPEAYKKLKGKKGYSHAGRKHYPVLCVETNVVYESQQDTERKLGIPQANIYKVLKGERKTAGGYHFKLLNNEEVVPV